MRTDYPGVPEGYHTATPYLMVRDADQAVEFYRNAFGAVELRRSVDPNGVVRNVQIKIGDSPVMLLYSPRYEVTPQPSDACLAPASICSWTMPTGYTGRPSHMARPRSIRRKTRHTDTGKAA